MNCNLFIDSDLANIQLHKNGNSVSDFPEYSSNSFNTAKIVLKLVKNYENEFRPNLRFK